jgi:hypothetical protein
MDNFNLKQYLVENKLTYQEKMKDKAKSMKEAEATSKPKEQEKGHQAPKDKSKQGPSTMNEAEGKVKINFVKKAEFNDINDKYDTKKGGKISDEEELIMDAGTWNSEGFFAKKYESLEDFAKFVEKTYGGNHKRHLSDLMKMKSKGIIKVETNESISLNEGKVFFGGY